MDVPRVLLATGGCPAVAWEAGEPGASSGVSVGEAERAERAPRLEQGLPSDF